MTAARSGGVALASLIYDTSPGCLTPTSCPRVARLQAGKGDPSAARDSLTSGRGRDPRGGRVEYRTLGGSGCAVSTLTLGTMTFGDETNEECARAQLDHFVEAGGSLDTPTSIPVGSARRSSVVGSTRGVQPEPPGQHRQVERAQHRAARIWRTELIATTKGRASGHRRPGLSSSAPSRCTVPGRRRSGAAVAVHPTQQGCLSARSSGG